MSEKYAGTIIEESLEKKDILQKVRITKTEVERVTPEHKTPWIKQWTMHTVEVSEEDIKNIAQEVSLSLDSHHNWYADFKNETWHYSIFRNKIFNIDRTKKEQYDKATTYGIKLGIPAHQLDFSPFVKEWKRT